MRMLVIFLTDLMEVLQPKRLARSHIKTALDWFDELDQITGGKAWYSKDVDMKAVEKRLKKALKE
ncbi:Hypothetical protein RG1141_CH31490 [Neorhizobium galegae bv. officinalis bv. officinalis str. HAMBI 1141]|uniref:Uncharacterized protein n=2 Tax=Neorhizobium galegae TaxID=399 RepID=A0A068TBL1_NEOGA|nr:Hypothetical protein RG1141_CH31490 [Neorhizobium galegae bv. officinalis bv. officinalis str. HAMBI 1141]